jgi:hypothetical protein
MNLKNQPPIFIPREHWREIEQLSKAALMDMVWDYAMQVGGAGENDAAVQKATLEEFRRRREIVLEHRKQDAPNFQQRKRDLKASFTQE